MEAFEEKWLAIVLTILMRMQVLLEYAIKTLPLYIGMHVLHLRTIT